MSKFNNKTILITGGASGIGLLMGKIALKKGAKKLIIWDRNEELLKQVLLELKQAEGHIVDVSDLAQIKEAFKKIEHVDILINNAGIIVGKEFWEHSHEEIDKTLSINTSALMHITKIALNSMIENQTGHIVNISSAASLVSNPKMSVYCASKWAVTGWSDSLRIELEEKHPNIKVTTILPYYISTGMFKGVKSPLIPILKPEYVALKIIRAVEKNKIMLKMPRIIYLVPLLKGIFPYRVFDLVLGKIFGIYKSMDDFKGRGQWK